ncbi:MAG: hypothetical protein R2780_14790 [Crocinitomicaceae bacterium]|nr:hypothetical protein [Crocinitomicaceae bacterium]
MKFIILFIPSLLILMLSCKESTYETGLSTLYPTKINDSTNFQDSLSSHCLDITFSENVPVGFSTKSIQGDICIEIEYRKYEHGLMALLITRNKWYKVIDSTLLTEEPCYVGTDTYFDPWIEINTNRNISVTDTTVHWRYGIIESGQFHGPPDSIINIKITGVRVIKKQEFSISKNGFIKRHKLSIEHTEVG